MKSLHDAPPLRPRRGLLPRKRQPSCWAGSSLWTSAPPPVIQLLSAAFSAHSKYLNTNDPSRIIIDELVGQWITLFFLPPDLLYYLIGFLLFRFFDIFKPWPANWADRKLHGGLGIMLDDVFAGIYSCIIVSSLFHMIG